MARSAELRIKVDIDQSAIYRQMEVAILKEMNTIGRQSRGQAKRFTRRRTGRLQRSIEYDLRKMGNGYRLTLKSDVPYASFYEYGTGPHRITAKPGRKLRFTNRGKVVYARSVNHPGARGRHSMSRALRVVLAARRQF